jgi:hypothetical protein
MAFGNTWQLALNKVHETPKTIVYNSRMTSMGATQTKEYGFKTTSESLNARANLETMRFVQQ